MRWETVDGGRYGTGAVPELVRIDTSLGPVALRDSGGPGPPILAVHGWIADSLTNWWRAAPSLAASHRLIAIDLPGHGHSPRVDTFTLDRAAAVCTAALNELGITEFAALGYSMGGPITQLIAVTNPERVTSLHQIATAAHIVPSATKRVGLAVAARVAGTGFEATRTIGRLLRGGERNGATSLARHAAWLGRSCNKRAVAEAGAELAAHDTRDTVTAIRCPVTVAVTAKDRVVPPQAQRELAELCNAQILEVAAGHVHCMDDTFANTVTALLNPVPHNNPATTGDNNTGNGTSGDTGRVCDIHTHTPARNGGTTSNSIPIHGDAPAAPAAKPAAH